MNKNMKHTNLRSSFFHVYFKKTLLNSSFLYIYFLAIIIFSSFLKAKYILLDAQASIQLITILTSPVCSVHFSHILIMPHKICTQVSKLVS